jgi:uncharacterized membrane protein (UPF0127 family)
VAALVLDDGRRVAVEVVETRAARRRGLLGRASVDGGVMLITKCRSVHTVGMRFTIDVAHLDASMRVLRVRTMSPQRLGAVVLRARHVLEADAGAFGRWGLRAGDQLRVEP